jgi:hypothetical protein
MIDANDNGSPATAPADPRSGAGPCTGPFGPSHSRRACRVSPEPRRETPPRRAQTAPFHGSSFSRSTSSPLPRTKGLVADPHSRSLCLQSSYSPRTTHPKAGRTHEGARCRRASMSRTATHIYKTGVRTVERRCFYTVMLLRSTGYGRPPAASPTALTDGAHSCSRDATVPI